MKKGDDLGMPIIFIGMHRSGTSLLGRLLEDLGLFVGAKKDENNEALFFLELNSWLMAQCGARWDNPEQIEYFWQPEAKEVLSASKNYVSSLMQSPRAARYLGKKRYFREKSVLTQKNPWGWKDPRNTFTLPFWLSLFPNARIVFIERHGVDVAQSLRVRAEKSISLTTQRYAKAKSIVWLRPKKGGFSDSPRSLSLEGGFSLWESYQREATKNLESLRPEQVFRVRYEDLLAEPQQILKDAAEFCGLAVTDERVQEITESINPSRAYSYRKSEELCKFSESNYRNLSNWGYKP
jgi:hypothetical protein